MAQTNSTKLVEQPQANIQNIQAQKIQAKWQAIASHLQNQLKQEGVTVKVARKQGNLYVILEFSAPDTAPQQKPVVDTLRQALEPLHQSGISTIKIGAQQRGTTSPVWVEKIELSSLILAKELIQWSQTDLVISPNWGGMTNIALGEGKKYLRFLVGNSLTDGRSERLTTLLALDKIREVVKISPQKVLAVPHTPDWLLGIYDWRGELIWLTDLNRLLGFGRTHLAAGGMMISLQVHQSTLGLFIPQVEEIEQHTSEKSQEPVPGLLPAHLLPYVQGYISLTNSIILDPSKLIQRTQHLKRR
jgi:positive phototaxis protein PixI